jgi:hypothetical protein
MHHQTPSRDDWILAKLSSPEIVMACSTSRMFRLTRNATGAALALATLTACAKTDKPVDTAITGKSTPAPTAAASGDRPR